MTFQEHLLACLIEECAEVQQRATKALRFGLYEVQPEQEVNNVDRLVAEVTDLLGVLDLLQDNGVPVLSVQPLQIAEKKAKVLKFANYARDVCGTISDQDWKRGTDGL